MKKIRLFLLPGLILLTSCIAQVHGFDIEGDPWVKQYRKYIEDPDTDLTNKEGEKIKFFNGFSIGASAGSALFHGDLADYNVFAPVNDFSTYYKFGWRIYAGKEIKYGLKASLLFESGKLGGGRITGLQSPQIDFRTEYRTIAAMASLNVLGELFLKDTGKPTKTFLDVEVGIGLTLYRSLSFWTGQDERVRDFVGYTVTDDNPPTQRYTAESKTTPAKALTIPVGFTFGYRLNYKTDITASYTLNNLMTDRLDTWSRDWSAQDKYSYFGLGLRYNFNRNKEDYPKKKPKDKESDSSASKVNSDDKWRLFGSKKENVKPKDVEIPGPIESRQSNKIVPAEQNKDMEEIRMKMFELQLKLFEMQYLINGGTAPSPGK